MSEPLPDASQRARLKELLDIAQLPPRDPSATIFVGGWGNTIRAHWKYTEYIASTGGLAPSNCSQCEADLEVANALTDELNAQLDSKNAELAEYARRVNDLNHEIANLTQEKATLQNRVVTLEGGNLALSAQLAEQEEMVGKLAEKVETLEAQLAAAQGPDYTVIGARLDEIHTLFGQYIDRLPLPDKTEPGADPPVRTWDNYFVYYNGEPDPPTDPAGAALDDYQRALLWKRRNIIDGLDYTEAQARANQAASTYASLTGRQAAEDDISREIRQSIFELQGVG